MAVLLYMVLLVALMVWVARRHRAVEGIFDEEQLRILMPRLGLLQLGFLAYFVFIGLPWWVAVAGLAFLALTPWLWVNAARYLRNEPRIPLVRCLALWIGK